MMVKNGPASLALSVIAIGAVYSVVNFSYAAHPPFSISIVSNQAYSVESSAIIVPVLIKNITSHRLSAAYSFGGDMFYSVRPHLYDHNMQELPLTELGELAYGDTALQSYSRTSSEISPGASMSLNLNLTKIFEFPGPGNYFLSVDYPIDNQSLLVRSPLTSLQILP